MNRKTGIDEVWLKAAVLGCLWASSEIVIGGFLHSLRLPVAGLVLTSIGIVFMTAVSHLWTDRGLIWRAGLVCAVMKAISPSAVIFGPMIAIASQALIMEACVRVFRRNAFAYSLGGMMAMSWNFFYFVANLLVFYGARSIDLYLGLIQWSEKFIGPMRHPWLPVLIVLALHMAVGLFAGLLGIAIGRKALREPSGLDSLSTDQVMKIRQKKPDPPFPYSLGWLAADGLLLAANLALLGFAPWPLWAATGAGTVALWSRRYKNSLRPLLRPGFLATFALLALFSAALFAALRQGPGGLLAGLRIGLEMNFRAAVLLVGFSAVGVELRSPRIGRGLARSRFRQLPAALEMAFETLPAVIAGLPEGKTMMRRPVSVFHRLVAEADEWLRRVALRSLRRPGVVLFTGFIGEGKSSYLSALVETLREKGFRVAGILSPSVRENGVRIGYDLVDAATGERKALSRTGGGPGLPSVGNYRFDPAGVAFGRRALSPEAARAADLVVVDEVGPWELKGQGWAPALGELARATDAPMVWVVRAGIESQVEEYWALHEPLRLDIGRTSARQAAAILEDRMARARVPAADPGEAEAPAGAPSAPAAPAVAGGLPPSV